VVERFSHFLVSKIAVIRATLDAFTSSWTPKAHIPVAAFSTFSAVKVHDIPSLILSCPSKSSTLDPIPFFVLKECLPALAPSITNIINLSLSTWTFRHEIKLSLVIPLLKKQGLDPDVLSNYRTLSLLSFLSKFIERVLPKQLVSHLESHSLFVFVQSSYRAAHSTELYKS
jgi:hypothetical protein